MKKLINFRPFAALALSFMSGVVVRFYFVKYLALAIAVFAVAVFLVLAAYEIIRKGQQKVGRAVLALLCAMFAVIGYVRLDLKLDKVNDKNIPSGTYTIVGEVKDISVKSGYKSIILTSCRYNGKAGGDLYIKNFDFDARLYEVLEFNCEIAATDGENSFYTVYGAAYTGEKCKDIKTVGRSDSLFAKIKFKIDETFLSAGSGDASFVAIAIFTGDTSRMGFDEITTFRSIGIAHIFAVSGMHIGLVYVAIGGLLGKIIKKRKIYTPIICAAIILYAGVCGFSPSALRAAIICICLAFSNMIGRKVDKLNSLSLAAFFVVMINPLDLFSVGFSLSFAISLALIILLPPVKRALNFLPDKISESLSAIIASEAVVVPLSVYYFGAFPLTAVVANLILIPVVTVTFYLLWIFFILCLILPVSPTILLFAPYMLIDGTLIVSGYMADVPLFVNAFPTAMSAVYYPSLLISSDVVNAPKAVKYITSGICFILFLLAAALF